MQMLIYIAFGFLLGVVFAKWRFESQMRRQVTGERVRGTVNPEQVRLKQEHLEKVLEMAREKGEIANDDVEKALGVSDSTAQRYLQELEATGKLQQIGERGKYVIYKAVK